MGDHWEGGLFTERIPGKLAAGIDYPIILKKSHPPLEFIDEKLQEEFLKITLGLPQKDDKQFYLQASMKVEKPFTHPSRGYQLWAHHCNRNLFFSVVPLVQFINRLKMAL